MSSEKIMYRLDAKRCKCRSCVDCRQRRRESAADFTIGVMASAVISKDFN